MKKLMYIFLFLMIAANVAAQESYVIELVCSGTDREYRIDTKEKGSTWDWFLKDSLGIDISKPAATDFWVESSPGDTTWGSEINILWNDIGKFYLSTLHYSSHGCDTLEQGWVEVFEPPGSDAGIDIIVCVNEATVLSTDSAWNFGNLLWTSTGDGIFDDPTKLHPSYLPGEADSISGSVILILTAGGKSNNATCQPAIDSMEIHYSNPLIKLTSANLLCFNDSTGWAKATVSGGIEPYKYDWTGPGVYTATSDSVFGLSPGMYLLVVTDGAGCSAIDSVEITEPLELLASVTASIQMICDDDSILLKADPQGGTGAYLHLWTGNGAAYLNDTDTISPYFEGASTGLYQLFYTVTDENGCTAIDTIDLTVLPKDTITYDTIICGNEVPYVWNGNNYFTSDTYIDTLVSALGCDTILMLNLTVLPIDTIKLDTTICISETPLAWHGENYFVSGNYLDTITPATGCDTILVLNLTVTPRDTITVDTVICGTEVPFALNGKNYFKTDVYTDTIPALAGCDTILILDLTVLPIDTISIDTVVCGIDIPFAWFGRNYYTTGVYTNTYKPMVGCDTIIVVDISVLPVDSIKTDTIICDSELPFVWNSKNYMATGIYKEILINATGCDTVAILDLKVLPKINDLIDTTICATSAPFVWNGKIFNTTGVYHDTLFNANGCDTILMLDLKILPEITVSIDTAICAGDVPFSLFGKDYFTTGIYYDTVFSKTSCDTFLVLDLKVTPEILVTEKQTICEGKLPYKWFNITFNSADTVVVTNPSLTSGCDTLRTLELQTIPEIYVTEKITIYESQLPYFWFNELFTQADTIIQTRPSLTGGCDTIRTLELIAIPGILVTEKTSICENLLPYTWFKQTFVSADTIVTIVSSTTGGSDTIRTLQLQTIPVTPVEISIVADRTAVCSGKTATFTATTVNGGTSPLYTWYVNGKVVPGETAEIFTYNPHNGDEVYATVQSSLICSTGNPAKAISVYISTSNSITPAIAGIGPFCQFSVAPPLPATSINGVTGTWFPSKINTNLAVNNTYTFTPDTGQCALPVQIDIEVLPVVNPLFVQIGPICQNSVAPLLPLVSTNSISGTWNPANIDTNIAGTNTYTFTPDSGECAVPVSMSIEITPVITPVMVQIDPLCQNTIAPVLPLVSVNGITGSWSPAFIDTKNDGLFTFTFTPDAGQCAEPVNMTIIINPEIIPAFSPVGPLCLNSAAPILPLISDNGITGTWSPAVINTSLVGTTTYLFTPDARNCEIPVTMDIEITDKVNQVFASIGPFCQNSIAPSLPLISDNGIKGSWSPDTISTDIIGISQFRFTPDSGECALPATIDIEITDKIKPLFAAMGPFCQSSIAPSLPLVSDNNIKGTWSPDTILTDITGISQYKFTPDSGECAIPVTIDIEITDKLKTQFAAIGPLCKNSLAPVLPTVSLNGFKGTWSPALIQTINTGTFIYTFTPLAGQCAAPADMIVEITPEIIPAFSSIGPICHNSVAPVLPLISDNGIKGSWSPAIITTSVTGTTSYKFIPDANQCAVAAIINIEITDKIMPLFSAIDPLCQNSKPPVLPEVSEEGISGTWSPDTIKTNVAGTFTYTFIPDAGQCAIPVVMNIEITNEIIPVFAVFAPICPNSVAPLLPLISSNGITGTWNPAIIDTKVPGAFTFTFTPDSGQCGIPTTMKIEISDKIAPSAICHDFTLYLDVDGKASVTTAQINNGSNDNCKLDTLFLSKYDFDCSDVGKNPVTLFAVDGVGLRDSCEATVTVLDTIKPVVICKGPFEIQLDENAQYSLTVAEILVDASDVCGIDTIYIYPKELDCDHIGITTIRLWAVGVNGDSAYCESQVTIYGNKAPTVVDDSTGTMENKPVIIEAVANDFDEKTSIDITSLSISIKPKHGVVTINPVNGDFTYSPDLNFSGIDVFEYRICDDGIPCEPECGKAFVFITVEPVNDKPVAVDDYYDAGCFSVNRNVLENDTDPDGTDNLLIDTNPLTPPNHGSLIIDPDGTINFFPNEGFIGIDSFEYVIWDNGIPSLSDTAKVYIEVDCNEENANPLECELFIPEGFSPNEDGIHDFFRIMCIHNYPDAKLMIFNRNGNLLWEKEHYGNYDVWGDQYNAWWWGTSVLSRYDIGRQVINGDPKLKVGNYVYVLILGNGDVKNGTVMISY